MQLLTASPPQTHLLENRGSLSLHCSALHPIYLAGQMRGVGGENGVITLYAPLYPRTEKPIRNKDQLDVKL